MLCAIIFHQDLINLYDSQYLQLSLNSLHKHTQTCPEATVGSVALLTFHCILHIQGEEAPHDLRADLAHTQLLWKPGGIKMDFNQNHFRIMTRLTGWPNGLAQPDSLTTQQMCKTTWLGNLII